MSETESNVQMKHSSGHEQRDVNVRGIVAFTAGLIVATLASCLVVWAMFNYLAARELSRDTPLSPLSGDASASASSAPQLQASPSRELQEMRAKEEALLHSYGWVDQQAGIVRIPIERAMRLLAERENGEQKERE